MERLNCFQSNLAVCAISFHLHGRQYVTNRISLIHPHIDTAIATAGTQFNAKSLISECFIDENLKVPPIQFLEVMWVVFKVLKHFMMDIDKVRFDQAADPLPMEIVLEVLV